MGGMLLRNIKKGFETSIESSEELPPQLERPSHISQVPTNGEEYALSALPPNKQKI